MPLNPTTLSVYFSDQLDRPVSVTSLGRSDVGLSRETWFVRCTEAGIDSETALVIRMNSPLGAACFTPLRFEYEMYRRLHGTSLPVPAALWYEDDPDKLIDSREFYVREFVSGTVHPAGLGDPDHDEAQIAVAREHARRLASLHTLDWRALGFADLMPVPSEGTAAACAIDVLRNRMECFQYEPLPLFAYALSWLEDHQPDVAGAVALLKGSNGIGQEVWRGERIVAMCDWEMASIGDPALDWARCQGCVPALRHYGEREILDYYESLSGIHVSTESVRYYRVFYLAEMLAVCHRAGLPAVRGQVLTSALAWLATVGLGTSSRALVSALRAA